ncbi:MAG: ASCH domain-containing protein [Desulfobacula sp.]|jgi:predicted transcriptional regulator|uniref:ASCH domain-containing protein n=1 Tax=Desulfobacula sp. TaxID=2593537 RepID=UPI001DFC76C9|nr:ASCH domain-containing protein [Desulfobacula sp.]MBT3485480.1 ASCH domain-containing protein [Desulfobacula sp.]MBT3804826.1 ASCH domain-containing protein [Desulfobacula sp.]MBT4026187.1 ASCH domain-containing protein [Desulfobacula sp.]MBT4199752.1 ASCH domain-containing protein [Desulfobacula sp.]
MDKAKTSDVIALSIKPVYADAILSGDKTVEFRKNGIPEDIKSIVLYATQPVQQIVGYFDVKSCEVDDPSKLWENYGGCGHITFDDFNSYYKGKKIGKCFLIENAYRFEKPIPLDKCKSFSKSPQSFAYLLKTEWKNIKRKKLAIHIQQP